MTYSPASESNSPAIRKLPSFANRVSTESRVSRWSPARSIFARLPSRGCVMRESVRRMRERPTERLSASKLGDLSAAAAIGPAISSAKAAHGATQSRDDPLQDCFMIENCQGENQDHHDDQSHKKDQSASIPCMAPVVISELHVLSLKIEHLVDMRARHLLSNGIGGRTPGKCSDGCFDHPLIFGRQLLDCLCRLCRENPRFGWLRLPNHGLLSGRFGPGFVGHVRAWSRNLDARGRTVGSASRYPTVRGSRALRTERARRSGAPRRRQPRVVAGGHLPPPPSAFLIA